jgi:hypothetical protein
MMTSPAPKYAIGLTAAMMVTVGFAQVADPLSTPNDDLRTNEALVKLDYQVIKVPGDVSLDLAGVHVYTKLREGVYLGVGAYAPLLRGAYGGFMAFDVAAHLRHRIAGPLFATADFALGGGGGGRSDNQAKQLSGTGGFTKASIGLAYDFGQFAVGAGVTRMKFQQSLIDSTSANVFVTIPYSFLTGSYRSHGEALSEVESQRAQAESSETMVTIALDNFRQINPKGSNKTTIRSVDMQYSQYFTRDKYWFLALGVGYAGLPIYNQILGGVGQRFSLSQDISLYAQLGVGSGGHSPSSIDTASGLLVYPKVAIEYALTPSLGLSASVGYLTAPKGSSRNQTYALALTQHFDAGRGKSASGANDAVLWHGLRLSSFHQTQFNVRYRGANRPSLQMLGAQVDKQLLGPWYLAAQAAVAYTKYLGFPGYGEIMFGVGLQTETKPDRRLQFFSQLMAGANVNGPGVKVSGGGRYLFNDRLAFQLAMGQTVTRGSAGQRFSAQSFGIGIDYRFAVPHR